jgi:hypothetical protein
MVSHRESRKDAKDVCLISDSDRGGRRSDAERSSDHLKVPEEADPRRRSTAIEVWICQIRKG